MSDEHDQDELGQRRADKEYGEAIGAQARALQGLEPSARPFIEWCKEHMPREAFREMSNSFSEGVLGLYVGTWVDAGVDRETMKEFLVRFTDWCYDRYEAAIPYVDPTS